MSGNRYIDLFERPGALWFVLALREPRLEQLRADLRKTWHWMIAGAVSVLLGLRAVWRATHPPPPGPPIPRRPMR